MAKLKAVVTTNSPDLQDIVDLVNDSPSLENALDSVAVTPEQIEEKKFLTRIEKFLDEGYRASVEQGTEEQIRALISKTAIAEYENQLAKKNDQDLADAKARAKYAGEGYSDNTKIHKARIAYAYYILESRGKE